MGQVRKLCYRAATQRDFCASPLEMEHVLLSSHLLCFVLALGCWKWTHITPVQPGMPQAHQTSPPWPGSLLALCAMQVPHPAPACSSASSFSPSVTSEEHKKREGGEITPWILYLLIRLAVIKELLRSTGCKVCWHRAFQPCPLLPEEKQVPSLWEPPEVTERPGGRRWNPNSFPTFANSVLAVKGLVESSAAQAVPVMLLYKYVLCINMHLNPCLDSNLSVHPAVE